MELITLRNTFQVWLVETYNAIFYNQLLKCYLLTKTNKIALVSIFNTFFFNAIHDDTTSPHAGRVISKINVKALDFSMKETQFNNSHDNCHNYPLQLKNFLFTSNVSFKNNLDTYSDKILLFLFYTFNKFSEAMEYFSNTVCTFFQFALFCC